MPFEPQPGQVFRPRALQSHVHLVISAVTPDGRILTVNWTTLDDECIDDACILHPGDHPAIRHDSTVAYSFAELRDAEKFIRAADAGLLEFLPPLQPAVFRRILEGANKSLRENWKNLLPKF